MNELGQCSFELTAGNNGDLSDRFESRVNPKHGRSTLAGGKSGRPSVKEFLYAGLTVLTIPPV